MSRPTERVLSLLSLLQVRREWAGPELAGRLGVSERTVRRYVDALREMGYTVAATSGPVGGYQLQPGATLPPLVFDDEQALAVAVALQVAPTSVEGIDDGAARALESIRRVLPSRLRARVEAIDVVRPGEPRRHVPPVAIGTLEAIGLAIRRHERLRFDYVRDGVGERREIEPGHLVSWAGKWFTVGWDMARADWRVFRVDRMEVKTPGGARFTPRAIPGGVEQFIEGRFTAQGWLVRGTARLEAPMDEVLPWVSGASAVVEPLGESACRVTAGSWSWVALVGWFTMFDAPFVLEGPPELVQAGEALLQRLAAGGGG